MPLESAVKRQFGGNDMPGDGVCRRESLPKQYSLGFFGPARSRRSSEIETVLLRCDAESPIECCPKMIRISEPASPCNRLERHGAVFQHDSGCVDACAFDKFSWRDVRVPDEYPGEVALAHLRHSGQGLDAQVLCQMPEHVLLYLGDG